MDIRWGYVGRNDNNNYGGFIGLNVYNAIQITFLNIILNVYV